MTLPSVVLLLPLPSIPSASRPGNWLCHSIASNCAAGARESDQFMKPAVSFCVSLVAGACALAAAIYPSMSVAARAGETPARTTVAPATDASSVSAAASAASAGIAGKLAAAPLASASSAAVGGSSAATNAGALRLPFSMLGAYQTLALRGLDDTRTVNVGVRLDRVVTAATLRLRYTYSPSLVFPMSHI